MISVISNGSKWAGELPDSIEVLCDVLKREPLNPLFEEYGNFIIAEDDSATVRFWGNFLNLSHVFEIDTDDSQLIDTLTALIRENQTRREYRAARPKAKTAIRRASRLVSAL